MTVAPAFVWEAVSDKVPIKKLNCDLLDLYHESNFHTVLYLSSPLRRYDIKHR
mgnify:CR=1 FL=1